MNIELEYERFPFMNVPSRYRPHRLLDQRITTALSRGSASADPIRSLAG
jgi:hypothetical protein